MAEWAELFVISPADGGWQLAHEYEEAEQYYIFAELDLAKAKAAELAGQPLTWQPRDGNALSACVEDDF